MKKLDYSNAYILCCAVYDMDMQSWKFKAVVSKLVHMGACAITGGCSAVRSHFLKQMVGRKHPLTIGYLVLFSIYLPSCFSFYLSLSCWVVGVNCYCRFHPLSKCPWCYALSVSHHSTVCVCVCVNEYAVREWTERRN